jgi:hypothetical protein
MELPIDKMFHVYGDFFWTEKNSKQIFCHAFPYNFADQTSTVVLMNCVENIKRLEVDIDDVEHWKHVEDRVYFYVVDEPKYVKTY